VTKVSSDPYFPTLSDRIDNNTARVIHVGFKKEPLRAAIDQFNHSNLPNGPLNYYTRETYQSWGLLS